MSKKEWDNDWIHFSKRARRGVFVLLIFFIAVAVSPRLYYNYIYTPPDYTIEVSPIKNDPQDQEVLTSETQEESRYNQPLEFFDPNTYTLEEWMSVGLSEKQANSILKYLSYGSGLKIKSDLKKLYVVDEELYALLEPKINLPDSISVDEHVEKPETNSPSYEELRAEESTEEKTKVTPLSLNTATIRELQTVNGIGPFFAQKIIEMRERYGGIISADQLLDIYNMDEEKLEAILPYLIIDVNEVNKLNVNTASEEQLRKHPLITKDMAKSIVYFRENYEKYKTIDELLLSPYIDSERLKEIKPFLKVE